MNPGLGERDLTPLALRTLAWAEKLVDQCDPAPLWFLDFFQAFCLGLESLPLLQLRWQVRLRITLASCFNRT